MITLRELKEEMDDDEGFSLDAINKIERTLLEDLEVVESRKLDEELDTIDEQFCEILYSLKKLFKSYRELEADKISKMF